MRVKPRARSGVVARPVGTDLVVYDPETHMAHCLNRTAALVLHSADGETSLVAMARKLAEQTGTEPDENVVWTTLERLAEANLLETPLTRPESPSRRRTLVKLGVGAATLAPIVASLVVPTPAEAAATCIQQAACDATTIGNQCYVLAQSECLTKICTGVGACN